MSPLCDKVEYEPQIVLEGESGTLGCMSITIYTACSVSDTPNLGRYAESLDVVPSPIAVACTAQV